MGWFHWVSGGTDEVAARDDLQDIPGRVPERYKGTARDFDNFGTPGSWLLGWLTNPDVRTLTDVPHGVEIIAVRTEPGVVKITSLLFDPPL